MKKAWLVYTEPYPDDEDDFEDDAPEFHTKEPGRWTSGRVVEIVYAEIEEHTNDKN